MEKIHGLNADPKVHGIIVQMPLDCDENIDEDMVTNAVSEEKDVDGLSVLNQGKIATGYLDTAFAPCTPSGCMTLIESTGIPLDGCKAVVIGNIELYEMIGCFKLIEVLITMLTCSVIFLGRSKIVGTPMSELLKWKNCTVTTCHSKTKDLGALTKGADLLVVAIGKPNFVPGDWIKQGAVVIDCGINSIPDPSKKSGKL